MFLLVELAPHTQLTYIKMCLFARCNLDPYISSGPTNSILTTHMLPRPHWCPSLEVLTLCVKQRPPSPTHSMQAEAGLLRSYKKMPHLGINS